jgi:2-oxoisovalerate ferredoxin oxidoreductase gamma subunit
MKEIIFYGRGGQGAVTAANLIVQAAFLEGKYGSAYPSFGAERRGAVVNGYARIDDKHRYKVIIKNPSIENRIAFLIVF